MPDDLRPILELSTAELHELAMECVGGELPALEACENEDWGRDYLLQVLQTVTVGELESRGFSWD